VNPVDWKIRAGYVKDVRPVPMPFIPGIDISGVVEATGLGVTRFKEGDEAFGGGSSGYAELAIAKESELALKPASLDHIHAAAVPVVAASTTWQALFSVAVVIHNSALGKC